MRIYKSTQEQVAPGFIIRRGLPVYGLESVGPFLLLDHMGPKQLKPGEGEGVPEHPHRGFETISYLVDGAMEHQDSLGNRMAMGSGEVQWMTAGSGILHAEFIGKELKQNGGLLHGFQIWVNLPRQYKMIAPAYQQYKAGEFPVVQLPQAKVKVLAGSYNGNASPIRTKSPLFLFHIELEPGASVQLPVPAGYETALYVATGNITANAQTLMNGQLAFSNELSDILLTGGSERSDVLFFGGLPIDEPVAAYGPFVMNEPGEIRDAILDYQAGKFGKIELV